MKHKLMRYAINAIAEGGMSDWLKVVSSTYNVEPFEVLQKQMGTIIRF